MNYKKYNDYELVYMVRENDEDSKDILFNKYYPVIKSITNEYYQRFKNYGYEYDDFLQEAMLAFEKAICSFDETKNSLLYTFINLCIRRSLLSFCRNISGKKYLSLNNLVDIDNCNVVDLKNNVSTILDNFEMDNLCKEVIFNLPFEFGTILELKFNGFSYKEISILLDIPISTVEFRVRKAKLQMKKVLKEYYSS